MIGKETRLEKLTLGQMLLINSLVIVAFMAVNSLVCPDGNIASQWIKQWDNKIFTVQMIVNLFASAYLLKKDKSKLRIIILNLFLTSIIYLIAGTLHSISIAGLF